MAGAFTFGDAHPYGSAANVPLGAPITGMAADPATGGDWLVGTDGGIRSFHAALFGSTGVVPLAAPVSAMAATPNGAGYWLLGSDGVIFSFGDAPYYRNDVD